MYEQLLKTSGADVLSSRKKLKKPSEVGGGVPTREHAREHDLVKISS